MIPRPLFLIAPRKKRCTEKTGYEYHPNNQRPRRVIPKAVNEHDECNHATAKQSFPMTGHALKFSHTGSVKPARTSGEKNFTLKRLSFSSAFPWCARSEPQNFARKCRCSIGLRWRFSSGKNSTRKGKESGCLFEEYYSDELRLGGRARASN